MKVKFSKKDILTIPNFLTTLRILMIPLIVWLYCFQEKYKATLIVILLSGITDVSDGFIARRFNMISNFGKLYDPVADKLTQATLALCLWTRFPHMIYVFILMAIKETIMLITGYLSVQATGKMQAAVWHGKVNTVLLYMVMFIHIFWYDIPSHISDAMLLIVACMMILSLILYARMNMKKYKENKNNYDYKE